MMSIFTTLSGLRLRKCIQAGITASKRWCSGGGPLTLYADTASPPGRFVIMTACYLQIGLNVQHVDLFSGEQNSPEFYEINPMRKVPVLVHGGFTIRDSGAIALYLCEMCPGSLLFPLDACTRAMINEMMFYNSGVLFPVDSAIMSELFRNPHKQPDQNLLDEWAKSLDYVDFTLRGKLWLAGNYMSLADLCCGATVSTVECLVPLNCNRHPYTVSWISRLKAEPVFQMNFEGMKRLRAKIAELKCK